MRRIGVLVLASALLVVGLTYASASASGGESFRVTAVAKQFKEVDVAPKGTNIGDYYVFSEDVYRGGRSVGELNGVCTYTRIDPKANQGSQQCLATVSLPRGDLMLQGVIRFSGVQVRRFTAAVTGGTGHFTGLSGKAVVTLVSGTRWKAIHFSLT